MEKSLLDCTKHLPHSVCLDVNAKQARFEFVDENGERVPVVRVVARDSVENVFEWKVLEVFVTFQPNNQDADVRDTRAAAHLSMKHAAARPGPWFVAVDTNSLAWDVEHHL